MKLFKNILQLYFVFIFNTRVFNNEQYNKKERHFAQILKYATKVVFLNIEK